MSVAMAHGSILLFAYQGSGPVFFHYLTVLSGFGMTLFFVLSGFVIHYNYKNLVREGFSGIRRFFWARFARLYPLFFLIVLTDLILGNWHFRTLESGGSALMASLQALPHFLLLIHTWTYDVLGDNSLVYQLGVNAPLTWSISAEWFFYAVYPVACLALLKIDRARTALLGIGLLLTTSVTVMLFLSGQSSQIDSWATGTFGPVAGMAHGFQDSYVRWLFYFSPYIRIGEFLLGCLVAQLYFISPALQERSQGKHQWFFRLQMLSVALIILVIWLQYSPSVAASTMRSFNLNYGLAPSVALLIFACACQQTRFTKLIGSRLMIVGGEASYSIYLIHFLVFWLIASGSPKVSDGMVHYLLLRYVFGLFLIIILSVGIHFAFEAPMRSWIRRQVIGAENKILEAMLLMFPLLAAASFWGVSAYFSGRYADKNPVSGLIIHEAIYGANCGANNNNAVGEMRQRCNGENACSYTINVSLIGDAAPGCAKDFRVLYSCLPDPKIRSASVPGEAGLRSRIALSCE